MTTVTSINPAWLEADAYISFLNRVFRGQWDRAAYDWYIARAFNGRASDVLVRLQGHRIVSGLALCYRQVDVGALRPIEVCVISGAATLPGECGRGHYGSLLQAALERSRSRGCAALLGFVTRNNGSGRGLVRLGARAIPSFYIVSAARQVRRPSSRAAVFASTSAAASGRPIDIDGAPAWVARREVDSAAGPTGVRACFHYERVADWRQQFIQRPHGVRAVRLAHDSIALIESVQATDRLQWLACPPGKITASIAMLAEASAAVARAFFMYTLDPRQAAAARRLGLRAREGYLLVQPTGHAMESWHTLAHAVWQVQSGDRV